MKPCSTVKFVGSGAHVDKTSSDAVDARYNHVDETRRVLANAPFNDSGMAAGLRESTLHTSVAIVQMEQCFAVKGAYLFDNTHTSTKTGIVVTV